MTDKKISELTALTAATSAADDEIVIVDTSATETKRMTRTELRNMMSALTGDHTITNGNYIVGTAGKGIDFSAHGQAAGMTSELLDDYEEGTWTPAITFGGTAVGVTYGSQYGFYVKIGQIVWMKATIGLTSKGSSNGNAQILGMPFTPTNDGGVNNASLSQLSGITFADFPQLRNTGGSTALEWHETTNGGVLGFITDADFSNTSSFGCSIIIKTT